MSFDFIIYLSGICGFVMVCGAIWLLHEGVIKLTQAGRTGQGLTVEIEKRIKISTSYPALGLFLIGLIFVLVAMHYAKPERLRPLELTGRLQLPSSTKVTVKVTPETWSGFLADSDGTIRKPLSLDFDHVRVEIEADGYAPRPFTITRKFESDKRVIELPEGLQFTPIQSVVPNVGDIASIPSGVTLVPFQP